MTDLWVHPSASFFVIPAPLLLSSQYLILGSSFHKMVCFNITFILTNLIKFLDSSVTRWNDKVMGIIPEPPFLVIQVAGTGIQDTTLVINI
ncbi:hypothetical protein [Wolbachia pipientis]|uniref:hypothetical protein n=1 Tax=Wolbachia pipientis TaxID=955 RepID=UPI00202DD0C1|nr:hypothetical protein [Wolbachia pipientis]MCM1001889.1 hypothetical protein [Wolbachia pipientis]